MAFDFSAVSSPFRMQPGLRRLPAGSNQLTPNHIGDRALQEKLAVLASHPEQALLCDPGFDPTAALRRLAAQAAAEHPQAYAVRGSGGSPDALGSSFEMEARNLRWTLRNDQIVGDGPAEIGACLRGLAPKWRATALLCLAFAEDFAVIDGATARIPWLAVCLPSHWAPEEKIGRHFAQVHAPVADNQVLLAASDHLARLVTGTERWERFVWTISRDPHLSQHPKRVASKPWPATASADELAAQSYFRSERQTFIPVADQRLAIFTIHVESQPLQQAIESIDRARLLHDALATMSPAVLEYRNLAEPRDRLLEWLSRRAGVAGEPTA
jgi:dimethylamine monooxygenase subunit A